MNPHALHVYTDGAADFDSNQTGGVGYFVEFPDHLELEPLEGFLSLNEQGVHRLELLGIIQAMDIVLGWHSNNVELARSISGGVIFHTDRHGIIDTELTNTFRIATWRRDKWKGKDGSPIKHHDLLDQLDKKRRKVAQALGGKVEIVYTREKHNKKADKLSKQGKKSKLSSSKQVAVPIVKRGRRIFDGVEVEYSSVSSEKTMVLHCYRKVKVQNEYEIFFDICDGNFLGKKIRAFVKYEMESQIHRHHYYNFLVVDVRKNSVVISPKFEDVTYQFRKQVSA